MKTFVDFPRTLTVFALTVFMFCNTTTVNAAEDSKIALIGVLDIQSERATMPYDLPETGFLAGKKVSAIAAGGNFTCAIADGAAYCWGYNGAGQLGNSSTEYRFNAPMPVDTSGVLKNKVLTSIAAGYSTVCAIADGAAYCWGYNGAGQLGNGSTANSATPVAVSTTGYLSGKTITDISVESSSVCAIASGAAYCWGSNQFGKIGNNSTVSSAMPVPVDTSGVLAGKILTTIDVGASHTCAIASNSAYCWGDNSQGQLGPQSTVISKSLTPVASDTTNLLLGKSVTDISAGGNSSCAVANSEAYCWGDNSQGQLGNATTRTTNTITNVDKSGALNNKSITAISVSSLRTCAIAGSAAYCWGSNKDGGLGNNSLVSSTTPVAVNTSGILANSSVTELSVSDSNSCVISNNAAICWGTNSFGQVGNSTFVNSYVPSLISTESIFSGSTVTSLSINNVSACSVVSGKAYCWGDNSMNNLGILGSPSTSYLPTQVNTTGVLANKYLTQISLSNRHACALATDGTAFCWGDNSYGQLGIGTTISQQAPVAVDLSGELKGLVITAITTKEYSTCVIANGKVFCWGSNIAGNLGIDVQKDFFGKPLQTIFSTPIAVSKGSVLENKTVDSFQNYRPSGAAMSVLAGGRIYGWGGKSLSNKPVLDEFTNTGDLAGKVLSKASGGETFGCAIANSRAYCWGSSEVLHFSALPRLIGPDTLLALRTISDVEVSGTNICVISVGSLYCWGNNSNGQLGNHSLRDSYVPAATFTDDTLKDREVTFIAMSNINNGSVVYLIHRPMAAELRLQAEKLAADQVIAEKAAAEQEAIAAAAKAEQTKLISSLSDAQIQIAALKSMIEGLNQLNGSFLAQIAALKAQINSIPVVNKTTISCVKGSITKKITGANPVCPSGYKRK